MKRNKYIIGNWKMNGTAASIKIVNFISNHIINVTEKAFDDFAGGEANDKLNKKILGIDK